MKRFLLMLVIFLNYSIIFGQSLSNLSPQVIPSSPKTREFIKYMEYPVSYHTGLPIIDIPLYTIDQSGITIPISLSYHASGFKPNERYSTVGQGWTLNADYRISRIINSAPDEKCLSHLIKNENDFPYGSIAKSDQEAKDHLSPQSRARSNIDSDYDIFYYSYPGGNGRFLYERNIQSAFIARTLPFVPVDIKTTGNTSSEGLYISHIEITDKSGNIYRYGKTLLSGIDIIEENFVYDATSETAPLRNSGRTAWLLTEIISVNKTDTIYFEYDNLISRTEYHIPFSKSQTRNSNQSAYSPVDYSMMNAINKSSYTERKIKKIRTPKEEIQFIYSSDKSRLTDIKVYSNYPQSLLMSTSLNQTLYSNASPYWYKLDDVYFKDNTGQVLNKYSFSYYGGNFPQMVSPDPNHDFKTTYSIDYWGFFNGAQNSNLLSKEGAHLSMLNQLVGDADRSPNPSYAKVGVLKEITFPTGGKRSFEYEGNVSSYSLPIGGLRVKEIASSGDNKIEKKQFKYQSGISAIGLPNHEYRPDMKYAPFRSVSYVGDKQSYGATYSISASPQINYSLNGNPVIYQEVTEEIYNETNYTLGKIVHIFDTSAAMTANDIIRDQFPSFNDLNKDPWYGVNSTLGGTEFGDFICFQKKYRFGDIPEKETKIYNDEGTLIKNIKKVYSHKKNSSFKGLLAQKKYTNLFQSIESNGYYWKRNYDIEQLIQHMDEEIIAEYINNINDPIISRKTFQYDTYNSLYSETVYDNQDSIKTVYSYPYNYTMSPYDEMTANNVFSPTIEKTIFKNGERLYSIKNNYFKDAIKTNKLILPRSIEYKYKNDNTNPLNEVTYERYNMDGNILEYINRDAMPIIILWSYNNQYPIAEIKNASYVDVNSALATLGLTSIEALSASTNPDKAKLDKLRTLPILSNAIITTYKYELLVGMLESSDPSGITTYYEYDTFNRLKRTYIKDQSGKELTIQSYDYHYQNQ